MKFEAEYSITIKMDDIFMPKGYTEEEMKMVIEQRGRDNLKKYFNHALFDPDKKIIFEEIKYKEKE